MGGSSYDRDVYSDSSSSSWGSSSSFGASSYSASRFTSSSLDSLLKPNGKILESKTKSPIIVVVFRPSLSDKIPPKKEKNI